MNQWEILTEEFSLTFMLRIIIYNIIFWIIDKYCKKENKSFKETALLGFLLFCTIILCSQGYFPALVGTILLIFIIHNIFIYHEKINNIIKYGCIVIFMLLAVTIYMQGLQVNTTNKSGFFVNFITFILNGNIFKARGLPCASC
jgi:hypothetical protein